MAKQKISTYTLSPEGYQFLLKYETKRVKPFVDYNGYYTVGLRHNGPEVNPLHTYTDEEIKMFFDIDRKKVEEDVNKIFDPMFMNQNMFDACFSFAFSIGGNISQTELGKIIQKNPYDDTKIRELWEYTYTNSKKSKRLMKRREAEINLYFKDYDNP